MTFKKGKQKFEKDEIIDILKRNVTLFKDEEDFVQYIVDLALYLVEHRIMATSEYEERLAKPTTDPSILKRQEEYRRSKAKDMELYNALKKHSSHATQDVESATCRMCGAPTGGRAVCPVCGGMAI